MSDSVDTVAPNKDHRNKQRLKVDRHQQTKREARLEHLCGHYFLDEATSEARINITTIIVTYDLGAGDNYSSEADRTNAHMPIVRKSTKRVNVATEGTSTATHVTPLPIPQLSKAAFEAHTFEDFPTSLLNVGKINAVHTEEDVL